jgi:hypothetical protein
MHMHSRLAAVLGCMATLAMVGCATNGGLTPQSSVSQGAPSNLFSGPGWIEKNGVLYHVPHYMVTREMAAQNRIQPNLLMSYGGGEVLTAPKLYVILWGYKTYGDPDKVAKLLKSYMKNEGGSLHNNIYTQYYMKVGGNTTYITNPPHQLAAVWEDTKDAVPSNPSEYQVAQEALVGVKHFGYDQNGSYVVATPHGHSTPGFGTTWCAYHSNSSYDSKPVSFTNLPYQPDAGTNCGANFITPPSDETGTDEGVTIVEGHEYGESITDPVPFTGWNSGEGEIGDVCAWEDIQNDPFGKKSYTMQPMYSNATESCVQSYGSN